MVKNQPASAGDLRDLGSVWGLGRSPGEGNGNPLQYSCLENPMDRGAWWATVHGVTELDTAERLSTHLQARFTWTNISISVTFPKSDVMEPPYIMSPELCMGLTGAERAT